MSQENANVVREQSKIILKTQSALGAAGVIEMYSDDRSTKVGEIKADGTGDFTTLKKAGTEITPSAEELNKVDGNYILKAVKGTIAFDVADPFTVTLGTIPSGAVIVGTIVEVKTAFNAATTNVLTVGHGASLNEFVAAADVNETAAGTTVVGKMSTLDADKVIKAKFVQTGGAATTGEANVTVLYLA